MSKYVTYRIRTPSGFLVHGYGARNAQELETMKGAYCKVVGDSWERLEARGYAIHTVISGRTPSPSATTLTGEDDRAGS